MIAAFCSAICRSALTIADPVAVLTEAAVGGDPFADLNALENLPEPVPLLADLDQAIRLDPTNAGTRRRRDLAEKKTVATSGP